MKLAYSVYRYLPIGKHCSENEFSFICVPVELVCSLITRSNFKSSQEFLLMKLTRSVCRYLFGRLTLSNRVIDMCVRRIRLFSYDSIPVSYRVLRGDLKNPYVVNIYLKTLCTYLHHLKIHKEYVTTYCYLLWFL